MIQQNDYDATLIYFYCHGQNTAALQPNQNEKLEVDNGMIIEPPFLNTKVRYSHGPVVFLNSCSTARSHRSPSLRFSRASATAKPSV
jgi:hypothetical protein